MAQHAHLDVNLQHHSQVKMRELGVTTHSDYKVTLLMDHKSMVTVRTDKYGA